MVQASGWPGYRPGHRQLPAGRAPAGRRAARRRARGQGRAGRRAGGRPGRPGRDGVAVGEPQNPGQRQAVLQHQAGRRPVLKLRSFAGGEAAEQGGPGASGLPFLLFVLAGPLRSGRAAAPAGPPGRSPRLRCNPRSRRGICRPWPAQDPGNRHPGFERGEDQAGACSPGSGKASQAQGRGQEESVGVSHRHGAGLPSGSRRRHHRGIDAAPGRAPRAHRATERHRPATGDGSLPWAASPGSPRAAHPAQPASRTDVQHPRPADREPAG